MEDRKRTWTGSTLATQAATEGRRGLFEIPLSLGLGGASGSGAELRVMSKEKLYSSHVNKRSDQDEDLQEVLLLLLLLFLLSC